MADLAPSTAGTPTWIQLVFGAAVGASFGASIGSALGKAAWGVAAGALAGGGIAYALTRQASPASAGSAGQLSLTAQDGNFTTTMLASQTLAISLPAGGQWTGLAPVQATQGPSSTVNQGNPATFKPSVAGQYTVTASWQDSSGGKHTMTLTVTAS